MVKIKLFKFEDGGKLMIKNIESIDLKVIIIMSLIVNDFVDLEMLLLLNNVNLFNKELVYMFEMLSIKLLDLIFGIN